MGILVQLPPAPQSTLGDSAGTVPVTETASTPQSGTAAANTQVQITIPGVAGQTIRITHLSWSYSAAPTGGAISIVVNAVTIFQLDDAAIADIAIPLPPGGLKCAAGFAAVVTLTPAGAAVVGKLNVASYMGA
jgi:hypothetical protein